MNIKELIYRTHLYIAASLDQRIAEPDGGIEWLNKFPINEEMDIQTEYDH